MKRPIFSALSLLMIIVTGIIFFLHYKPEQESIIFFPIAENVHFTEAKTHLSLTKEKELHRYVVKWSASSTLDRNAYLRQDISLLFANGRLIATSQAWKEDEAKIFQMKEIYSGESKQLNAITFHYAELHVNENMIESSQQISADKLYVIDSLFSPLQAFRIPKTHEQIEWKDVLDQTTNLQLQYSWNQLMEHFRVSNDSYLFFPLTNLVEYNNKQLPGLSKKSTQIALGNLWEGLYKNYFLGIKKNNGSIIEPLDSTLPLIGISKDLTHLIVLTEAKDGTPIKLIQSFAFSD